MMKRIVVLLLVLVGLLVPAAAAPADWAAEAVDFAVENRLLRGSDLRLEEPASRAELAAILSRLLGLEDKADLSAYSDVQASDWYADDMARAVAAGLIRGQSGSLKPRQAVTREDAAVILGRCFGVPYGQASTLARFQDQEKISDWALEPLAGMVSAGYFKGSGGMLRPKDPLTRQELAVMLWKMAGSVVREQLLPESGSAVVPAGQTLPVKSRVDGNLVICGSEGGETVLEDLNVSGRLTLLGGAFRLGRNVKAAEIACGRGVTLQAAADTSVRIFGGGVTLRGGPYTQVLLDGAKVTVEQGTRIRTAVLQVKGAGLLGDGRVDLAKVQAAGCQLSLEADKVEDLCSPGLEQVQVTARQPVGETKPAAAAFSTTVEFTQVPSERSCVLSWYIDGELVQRDLDFHLTEGATATYSGVTDYTAQLGENGGILVRISDSSGSAQLTQTFRRHLEELQPPVQTMLIEATVVGQTSLYQDQGMKNWIASLPAGTVVQYSDYRSYQPTFVLLSDGRTGWVPGYSLRPSTKDFVQKTDYTVFQKERFVNENSYASDTGMLVWISRLTQKVNVFTGSQGNWTLTKTFDCCSGKNSTPTVSGVFQYYSRTYVWDFNGYYVKKPMLFNGGHAFHTRTYVTGSNGVLLDPTLGVPRSHGCIRMRDEDVDWLWDSMEMGTTVVVY